MCVLYTRAWIESHIRSVRIYSIWTMMSLKYCFSDRKMMSLSCSLIKFLNIIQMLLLFSSNCNNSFRYSAKMM